MRKILTVLLALTFVLAGTFCAFADKDKDAEISRLTDKADLLSSSEREEVRTKLDTLSEYHGVNICIRTVDDTNGKTVEEYADDYYDNHYEGDGVMLLLSMDEHDWYITTAGTGIEAFTDYGISEVGDAITPYFSEGDYEAGFEEFTNQADRLYSLYEQGQPLDTPKQKETESTFNYLTALLTSVLIGLVFAFLITGRQKATLKSVRRKVAAAEYTKEESFRLTDSRDIFQYRTVNRVPKPKPQDSGMGGSSVHMSGGGVMHGGGGGKF